MTDQIFGLNGLINLANIAFLLAFALRDVLILRVLALDLGSTTVVVMFKDIKNIHLSVYPPKTSRTST